MISKIVLGYDDSEASTRALERVAALAKAFGSEVMVTSVAPIVASIGRSAGAVDPTDTPAEHAADLEHAKSKLDALGVSAELVPAVGNVADTIIELAVERGADLIVVGTRELNVLQRVLGQRISDAVSHKARCDVLIVH